MRTSGFLIILGTMLIWSCKTSSVSSSTTSSYSEDLSALRPPLTKSDTAASVKTPATGQVIKNTSSLPANALRTDLDSVNNIIAEQNKGRHVVDGYTIQVYTGSDREGAMQAKAKVAEINPDLSATVQYIQPNYKVKAGQYTDRLEAHEIFESLKKDFPQALLIPERISVSYE